MLKCLMWVLLVMCFACGSDQSVVVEEPKLGFKMGDGVHTVTKSSYEVSVYKCENGQVVKRTYRREKTEVTDNSDVVTLPDENFFARPDTTSLKTIGDARRLKKGTHEYYNTSVVSGEHNSLIFK